MGRRYHRSSRIEKKRSRPSGLSIWRDNLHGSCDKEKVRYGGQPWSAVSLCPDTALPCSSPKVGVNRREIACPASQVSTVPQRSEVHSGQAIHGKVQHAENVHGSATSKGARRRVKGKAPGQHPPIVAVTN
ncbi:hypothetical protein RRG08_038190 [Elysia crispata]|uniref:Uncharacterized protein n=1 Tax=Elysia crispata TaxID=231223 RepID=A0AAE1AN20_9GAST|nr:hypothetical protein RRG08_038190 [Elysia crispata]